MQRAAFLVAAIVAVAACAGQPETNATGSGGMSSSSSSGSSSASSGSGGASSSSSSSSSSGTGGAGTGGMGTGGMGTGGGTPCHWKPSGNDCGPGMYCNAPGCGDGTCAPVGVTEDQARTPICGCDGVTYWNKTVAASHGMPMQSTGVCNPEKTCGGFANLMCPTGTSCNYHLADKGACGASDQSGTCWAVPAVCVPQTGFGPLTRACGSLSCTDECNLIKLSQPWYDDSTCPQ